MNQHCILCGQIADSYNVRPGTPPRCPLHASSLRELGPWDNFSKEEAYQAGIDRVNSISIDEMEYEGKVAFNLLQEHREMRAQLEPERDALSKYYGGVIAANEQYLRAFD